jgi:transposase
MTDHVHSYIFIFCRVLASRYEIHPNQVTRWKNHLVRHVGELFEDRRRKNEKESEALVDELYKQIGQLKGELDWLKKKAASLRS